MQEGGGFHVVPAQLAFGGERTVGRGGGRRREGRPGGQHSRGRGPNGAAADHDLTATCGPWPWLWLWAWPLAWLWAWLWSSAWEPPARAREIGRGWWR